MVLPAAPPSRGVQHLGCGRCPYPAGRGCHGTSKEAQCKTPTYRCRPRLLNARSGHPLCRVPNFQGQPLDTKLIYDMFRHTPDQGKGSYLHDHYRRGLLGVHEPETTREAAHAVWRAGRDTASEKAH